MSIKITCKCGRAYWVNDNNAGKRLSCKVCGVGINVPMEIPLVDRSDENQKKVNQPLTTPVESRQRVPPKIIARELAGHHALASNPARTKISLLQYFLCRPRTFVFYMLPAILGGAVSTWLFNPIPLIVGLVASIIWVYRKTRRFQRILMLGNLNAGVVIAKNPWQVAVIADLATGRGVGKRLAIKVIPVVLDRMAGGPPEVGMRLSAPSMYGHGPDPTAWDDVFPIVLATFVRDPAVLESTMRELDVEDWSILYAWTKRNPSPSNGLYRLWPGAPETVAKSSSGNAKKGMSTKTAIMGGHLIVGLIIGAFELCVKQSQTNPNDTRPAAVPLRTPATPAIPPIAGSSPQPAVPYQPGFQSRMNDQSRQIQQLLQNLGQQQQRQMLQNTPQVRRP